MRLANWAIVFVLAGATSAGLGDPAVAVRKDHPRIFVTTETLGALRAKATTTAKDTVAKMHGADWIMKSKPGTEYTDIHNMPYPALNWLLTGQRQYLDKTREFLAAAAAKPPADQYQTPEMLRAAAMAYDWVYNDLSADERKAFAAGLVTMADFCAKLWRHSDFNNHFVNESLAVLWAGVALVNDGVDDAAAARFLKLGGEHLRSAVAGAEESAGSDGGQFEGFSYNDWGYARPLAFTYEMWRTATGKDLFAKSAFFKNQALWHAYCLRPDGEAFARPADCPSDTEPGENLADFMALLAARYNDPLAQWLADRVERKYVQDYWHDVLWRDWDLAATSPKELKLPAARLFGKLGWVAMRSSWDDPEATFSLFQCGPFYAGHQHLDANSFVIDKCGSLAIDSGTNDYGPHRGNYYARTIAHNSMLVFDPAEKFGGQAWSSEGADGSNDGGQMRRDGIERAGTFKPGGPNDVGRILAFQAGRHFVYVAGDATRAYSPAKLSEFTRQFIYLPPNAFVIYDRVTATKAEFAKTWLLHSINEPKVTPNKPFSIAHGKGLLTGGVVMPLGAVMRTVGGPGKEYWVNGKNYPPDKKPDPESGSWRIEISPAAGDQARSHQFLIVLTASGPGAYELPAYEGGGDNDQVQMTLHYQFLEYKLTFPRAGGLGGRLLVREKGPGGKPLEQANLAAGIKMLGARD